MTDSFRRIDYSVRPAKYAERRMLCDVFRRMNTFAPLETYQYVGFGSVWFSDFLLFHRILGIKDMLSIEQAVQSEERFRANRPFHIEMDFRSSSLALPELDFTKHQFIWLDYDDPITTDMLGDLAIIASRARSGTVLVVSVQCHKAPDLAEAERELRTDAQALLATERFRQRIGPARVSHEIRREDLGGWLFGDLSRSLMYNEVDSSLSTRNVANPANSVSFRKICDFEYEDGAKMTTIAIVFYSQSDEKKVNDCCFDQLDFLNSAGKPVHIPTPKLTLREVRLLESQLPLPADRDLDFGHIPQSEAQKFAGMYRYLPNFAVIES